MLPNRYEWQVALATIETCTNAQNGKCHKEISDSLFCHFVNDTSNLIERHCLYTITIQFSTTYFAKVVNECNIFSFACKTQHRINVFWLIVNVDKMSKKQYNVFFVCSRPNTTVPHYESCPFVCPLRVPVS